MKFFFICITLVTCLVGKEKLVGINLVTIPDSAKIWVDSTLIGYSPIKIVDTTAIVHDIRIAKEGFKDTTISMVSSLALLRKDTVFLQSDSTKAPISLTISTKEKQADISVDGRFIGREKVSLNDLTQGKHKIAIEGFNIAPYYDTIHLDYGDKFYLVVPVKKRKFTVMSALYSRDFVSYNFSNDTVMLADKLFVLNFTEGKRNQRDIIIALGESVDLNGKSFLLYGHIPTEDEFTTKSTDGTDSLWMHSLTWGAGIYRNYLRTIAAVENILRFDIGMFWGVGVKIRQYKYYSNNGSGGITDYQLENSEGTPLSPIRGYLSLGGLQTRIIAGYKHIFVDFSYQFNPTIESDGIVSYPDSYVNFKPVNRINIGLTGRW